MLAAHSESMVRDTCNKAMLLEHGRVVVAGSVEQGYKSYRSK